MHLLTYEFSTNFDVFIGGLRLRKIVQHEPDKDKTITIEGVYIESDRKDKLLQVSELRLYSFNHLLRLVGFSFSSVQ